MVSQMKGSGEHFIRSLRTFFGKDHGAENVMRFAYHISERFQIVILARHEPKP